MKTAIVTGATQGIGLEIVKSYVESNYRVLICARKHSGTLDKFGDKIRFIRGDVRERKTHYQLVDEAMSWTGRLDVYVNNAGLSTWKTIDNIDEEFLNMMIETNLSSVFWGSQAAASIMKKSGGVIINISSLAGKRGSARNSAYCASKFGVNGLTQSLAKELGEFQIRVNAVCPVYVKTVNLLDALKEEQSPALGEDLDKYFSEFAKSHAALKRLPQAEDIAQMCLFLSGDQSRAITGQCINVDCGVMPQ